jgi:hypothetical protein
MKILFSDDQERRRSDIKRMIQKEVFSRAGGIDEKDEIQIDIPMDIRRSTLWKER